MNASETKKFKDWFKRQPKTVLTEVYDLLQAEFSNRGENIETDRNFYSTSKDSPEQIVRSMTKHFDDVFEKHHGFGGF